MNIYIICISRYESCSWRINLSETTPSVSPTGDFLNRQPFLKLPLCSPARLKPCTTFLLSAVVPD